MKKILLLGDPVAHSRSPAMQNAALEYLSFAARYEARHTTAAELAATVAALRDDDVLGANVTLPHKEAVLPLLDTIEPEAAQIGAVNTIYKGLEGELVGANTDAPALLRDLAELGFAAQDRQVVVLGASGAARAAIFTLVKAGAAQVLVANRTLERAENLLADLFLALTDEQGLLFNGQLPPALLAFALDDPELDEYVADADLLVNATSLGWHGDETPLTDPVLSPDALVYDMVYRRTPLMRAAEMRGARASDGLGMLLYQGALAFEHWTGQAAPLDVMRRVLRDS
ncbi:shikimate dehydrogenase [Candidatus Gracilibacteria bacterium]|nr:shikimate dehydrogenase [Candidatus Gracilibacteria bacterium]